MHTSTTASDKTDVSPGAKLRPFCTSRMPMYLPQIRIPTGLTVDGYRRNDHKSTTHACNGPAKKASCAAPHADVSHGVARDLVLIKAFERSAPDEARPRHFRGRSR